MRQAFRAYRRWTDREMLDPGTRGFSAILPTMVVALLAVSLGVTFEVRVLTVTLGAVWLVWQGWALTRVWHAFQVADWVAGKRYEREGRYKLPPEYRDTEHASLAARRRRRKHGRK